MSETTLKPRRNRSRKRWSKAPEVARRAGVSLMTVSRVFNESESVTPETREKVLNAAKELGYEANYAARSLRTGQSNTVAMLMASHMSLRGEFHSEFFAGFEFSIGKAGFEVLISTSNPEEPLWKRAQRLVASRLCGGIVVRYDSLESKEIRELSKVEAPLVLANYQKDMRVSDLGVCSIGFDNRKGTRSAVRHLVSLGHERIAYLGGTPGWMDSIDREEGFRMGVEEHGLKIEERWVEACDFAKGFETAFERTAQILSRKVEGPTAVVCASDELAAGALACIRKWGKKVPADISIIGFDDNRWGSYLSPPLTTVRHDGWLLGEKVGGALLEMMKDDAKSPGSETILETQLIVRESTGPAPHE